MIMNPQRKAEWVAALRSANYPQARGALKRRVYYTDTSEGIDAFCCLGVVCELAAKANVIRHAEPSDADDMMYRFPYYSSQWGRAAAEGSTLPSPVMEWLGVNDSNPVVPIAVLTPSQRHRVPEYGQGVSLAELNDNGFTFAEIADIIEQHL